MGRKGNILHGGHIVATALQAAQLVRFTGMLMPNGRLVHYDLQAETSYGSHTTAAPLQLVVHASTNSKLDLFSAKTAEILRDCTLTCNTVVTTTNRLGFDERSTAYPRLLSAQ